MYSFYFVMKTIMDMEWALQTPAVIFNIYSECILGAQSPKIQHKSGGWGSPVPPPTNTKYKMYEPCWWAIVLPSINICRWTSARTMPHSPCLSFTTLGINVIYWHTRKHSPSINHAGITDMEIRVLCSKTNVLSHGDKGTAGSGQIQFWCWNRFWAGL